MFSLGRTVPSLFASGPFASGSESSLEFSLQGTFAPGSELTWERKAVKILGL